MNPTHRIALMFDLDGAGKQVREIALGVQRFIAMLTGYGTVYRLTRAFAEQEGMTPAEYRRRFGRKARPAAQEDQSWRVVIAADGTEERMEFDIPGGG